MSNTQMFEEVERIAIVGMAGRFPRARNLRFIHTGLQPGVRRKTWTGNRFNGFRRLAGKRLKPFLNNVNALSPG